MNKRIRVIIIGIAAIGFFGYQFLERMNFRYAGTLEATKVDLSAEVASTIAVVKVQEGDHVTEKQGLVELACDEIKVAARLANDNFLRSSRLYRGGAASQEAMDQAQNRKDDTDIRMGWCSVSSPIHGTVLSRYHEPGEWVMPGTKLLTLANIKDIWTTIYVPQTELASLKVGQKVKGFLSELGNREFIGTIIKINEEAEFTPKNVQTKSERQRLVFGVKISFRGANDEEILKPGMTVEFVLNG